MHKFCFVPLSPLDNMYIIYIYSIYMSYVVDHDFIKWLPWTFSSQDKTTATETSLSFCLNHSMWSGGSSCFCSSPGGIMQIGYLGMDCWSHQCWKLITTEEKPRAPGTGIVPLQFHRWRLQLKSLICWVRAGNSKMAHEASNSRWDIHPLQFSFEILYLCKHLLPFQKRTAACHPILWVICKV